ncbi:SPFH domain-containing protein, partial [Alkalimonas sp.]|uniref:SPFH domain-containing protein n=1 Tax=Alkalimonas sp. TaxID=1872453 RepID=UPI00263B96BA
RNMEAYSNDQQPAVMNLSVRYQIDSSRVDEVYRNFGTRQALIDRQVTRIVLEEAKTVLGQFNAATSIRERGRLNLEMAQAVQRSVTGPVIILGVQVEDVSFSAAYEESVEQRMLAEVAVERERQNLERERVEADIVRTRAAAEADRVRAQAQAEADSIRLRGNAEAEAIRERAAALANNPLLVELVKAETWDGKLPTTMLPNSTVPFIEANK